MTRWIGGISRLLADSRYPRGRVLGGSAVPVSGAADTNENILATVVVPARAMGLNGILRITALWSYTNSGNNKILQIRLGGIAGDIFGAATVTTTAALRQQVQVQNRNSAASQVVLSGIGTGGWGTTTAGVATATRDTAVAADLVFTGTKASAGETLTLESYLVELVIP